MLYQPSNQELQVQAELERTSVMVPKPGLPCLGLRVGFQVLTLQQQRFFELDATHPQHLCHRTLC